MDEVINAGYNVRIRNYDNGSSYSSSCITGWDSAASGTTAGVPVAMARGDVLDLGGGATLTCVVVRGQVIGGGNVSVSNENDLSIGLLLQYEGFDYFWASDLGGGSDDGSCTGRSTSQVNVETAVIQAISPGGAMPLIGEGGIDVLHVSHHGSESSTNNDLFDYAAPAVAVISTGAGQTSGWDLPRVDIVDNVLLANASCVTAPPTFVLQTEEGSPTGPLTSFSGYCVGDMKITTDGLSLFTIEANGGVNQGPDERNQAGLPRSFTIDESGGGTPGDTQAPVTAVTSPANGASVTGTIAVTASASDNVGVTSVEFWLDGVLAATDSSSPYSWSWNTATASPGSHSLVSKAYDAAGNIGTSAAINVTIASGVSVASYKITQAASALTYLLPAGTTIASKGYVVVARDATKAQFEAFWGVTLGANVTFINSAGAMPQINGDESYSLYNATNSRIDGATVSMASGAGESLQRKNGCGGANKATSWNRLASSAGTPGAGAPAACGKGIYISEFSDALGTGNYIYEFIELHNDK
jgi:hypothetical protein